MTPIAYPVDGEGVIERDVGVGAESDPQLATSSAEVTATP